MARGRSNFSSSPTPSEEGWIRVHVIPLSPVNEYCAFFPAFVNELLAGRIVRGYVFVEIIEHLLRLVFDLLGEEGTDIKTHHEYALT